jgi:frataxin-like iron-binding protein CyaY
MSSQITETQYHELVDQLLLSIEEALDGTQQTRTIITTLGSHQI